MLLNPVTRLRSSSDVSRAPLAGKRHAEGFRPHSSKEVMATALCRAIISHRYMRKPRHSSAKATASPSRLLCCSKLESASPGEPSRLSKTMLCYMIVSSHGHQESSPSSTLMLQNLSTSKTWASIAGAEAEEAPQALTYKVEVFTGDVRGAGTHVRLIRHSQAQN